MKKSVYSLVLTDDVVAQIDRLAYHEGTNRSNMINQILAEYVSYITPEKRIREVFDRIGSMLESSDSIRMAVQPSDTMMTLRSALVYKYNPTVRYHVELFRDGSEAVGELRVSMRTQNETLLQYLHAFYQVWMRVEAELVGECRYRMDAGRFCRLLCPRINRRGVQGMMSSNTLGDIIASYIRTFDNGLKCWFSLIDRQTDGVAAVRRCYEQYLHDCSEII